MLIEIIFAVLIGGICGIITGLIPGIHINLVAGFILVNSYYFLEIVNAEILVVFIISMGIIHSFVDFIPSVIFGVPDADTTLSVLPAHKLVIEGKAFLAIYLSSLGSLLGAGFAFLAIPAVFLYLEAVYDMVKSFIPYFLIAVVFILISMEKGLNKKFWAIIVVLFSSGFGAFVLNSSFLNDPLLPLFSGLFGLSTIAYSLFSESGKIANQSFEINFKIDFNLIKGLFLGGIASLICSVSPGLGNAQAAILASVFMKKMSEKIFLVIVSSINTISFILSFATFYLIERARNGSVFVISQIIDNISIYDMILYFIIIYVVSAAGFFITLYLGKIMIFYVYKLNMFYINLYVIVLLFIVVVILTGIYGLFVFIASGFLGIICILLEVKRVHLMTVLIIPVVFNLI